MVPQFKLRNNDMSLKALKWAAICKITKFYVILVAAEGFKKFELDKDVAVHVVKSVKA